MKCEPGAHAVEYRLNDLEAVTTRCDCGMVEVFLCPSSLVINAHSGSPVEIARVYIDDSPAGLGFVCPRSALQEFARRVVAAAYLTVGACGAQALDAGQPIEHPNVRLCRHVVMCCHPTPLGVVCEKCCDPSVP